MFAKLNLRQKFIMWLIGDMQVVANVHLQGGTIEFDPSRDNMFVSNVFDRNGCDKPLIVDKDESK